MANGEQHASRGERDAVEGERVEDARRRRLGGELVEGGHTDHLEHGEDGGGVGADVTISETRCVLVGRNTLRGADVLRRRRRPSPLSSTRSSLLVEFGTGAGRFPHGQGTWRELTFQRHRGLARSWVPERLTERYCSFGVHWLAICEALPHEGGMRSLVTPLRLLSAGCSERHEHRLADRNDRPTQDALPQKPLGVLSGEEESADFAVADFCAAMPCSSLAVTGCSDSPPSARSPGKSAMVHVQLTHGTRHRRCRRRLRPCISIMPFLVIIGSFSPTSVVTINDPSLLIFKYITGR